MEQKKYFTIISKKKRKEKKKTFLYPISRLLSHKVSVRLHLAYR